MELAEQTASHKGLAQASHLFLSYISLYTNAGTPSAREERFGEGGQRAKGPRTDGRRQGPRPVPLHSHQEDGSGPRQTGTIWHKGASVQECKDAALARKGLGQMGAIGDEWSSRAVPGCASASASEVGGS